MFGLIGKGIPSIRIDSETASKTRQLGFAMTPTSLCCFFMGESKITPELKWGELADGIQGSDKMQG